MRQGSGNDILIEDLKKMKARLENKMARTENRGEDSIALKQEIDELDKHISIIESKKKDKENQRKKSIKENVFYKVLDAVDSYDPSITMGYFPTIEELEAFGVTRNPIKYLPIIAYFANSPLDKTYMNEEELNSYNASVKYCNDILTKIELT